MNNPSRSHDNANAPAFPYQHDDRTHVLSHEEGLTKRELIAALVLQGIVTRGDGYQDWNDRAERAVKHADALLVALAAEPGQKRVT